jgi:hypothetical protein
MAMLIFSDKPAFTVALNLKQLSRHAGIKLVFDPIVTVFMSLLILIKHTMHAMGMHDVAVYHMGVHDVGMHSIGVHDMCVHSVGMHGMDVPDLA